MSRNSRSMRWNVGHGPSLDSGVWTVTTSALRPISAIVTNSRSPAWKGSAASQPLSLDWRGGSQASTSIPRLEAQEATIDPTWPRPTTPSLIPGCPRPRANIEASTYCATAGALQPGADTVLIPREASQGKSRWSVPMVAVATIPTREPSSNPAPHFVRVLTISASASATASRVISSGDSLRVSAIPAKGSPSKGIYLSITTFFIG